MDSGRLIFNSSSSHSGQMLILGGPENSIFRGVQSLFSMEEGVNKSKPFFTSPEELLEEEYYDGQILEKKRRLTSEQVRMLEKSFEVENRLEPERKSELAKKLGLQTRQVAVWFQNRRARWKTKQLEFDYDRLKAAYDSLLADHDSQLKDNDYLRSQVAILTEKLHTKEIAREEPIGDLTVDMINVHPTSNVNMSDELSTGSGGSALVDGEGLQLVDSCGSESYFHDKFGVILGATLGIRCGGVHSEEEDIGSDDGCNYLPTGGGLMFGDNNHDDDVEDNNWRGVWN